MKRYTICYYCGQRVKIEYGNLIREHHHPIRYSDGHVFWEICPVTTLPKSVTTADLDPGELADREEDNREAMS